MQLLTYAKENTLKEYLFFLIILMSQHIEPFLQVNKHDFTSIVLRRVGFVIDILRDIGAVSVH